MLVRPGRTFTQIRESGSGSYITPLLVISVLAIIAVLVAGPVRKTAALNGVVEYPPDYQYWSPEMQAQFETGISANTSNAFIYVFPAISTLAGVWLGWLLYSAILHLLLTIGGSRSSFSSVMGVTAWASTPLILRYLVRIIGILATKQVVSTTGLLGFAPAGDTSLIQFVASILPLIDLYLIWQVILVIIGAKPLSGLSTGKVISIVLVTTIIFLSMAALPGFIGKKLGGLSIIRPFFF